MQGGGAGASLRDNHLGTEPQLDTMEMSPCPKPLEQVGFPLGQAVLAGQPVSSLGSGVPSSLPPPAVKATAGRQPGDAGMQQGRDVMGQEAAGREEGRRKEETFQAFVKPLDWRGKR